MATQIEADEEFSEHFQAAVDLIERFADDHDTLVDAIEDRTYEEMEIADTVSIDEGVMKFEIDASELDISARWLYGEFELHRYNAYNVVDRRFTDNVDPDRLLIAVTEDARPVRKDSDVDE